MKKLLTRWEIEEENRKIGGNVSFIDREYSGNVLFINREYSGNLLLIDRKRNGNMLLIDRKLADLEYDAEYASLLKLTELVKKLFNLTRAKKEKSHHSISHFLTIYVKLDGRPCFFALQKA